MISSSTFFILLTPSYWSNSHSTLWVNRMTNYFVIVDMIHVFTSLLSLSCCYSINMATAVIFEFESFDYRLQAIPVISSSTVSFHCHSHQSNMIIVVGYYIWYTNGCLECIFFTSDLNKTALNFCPNI